MSYPASANTLAPALAETLHAADAATSDTGVGESACLLQWEASASKLTKRAPAVGEEAGIRMLRAAEHENGSSNGSNSSSTGIEAGRSEEKPADRLTGSASNTTDMIVDGSRGDSASLLEARQTKPGVAAAVATKEFDDAVEEAPKKNKVVLMILEMVPLCGPLGIDRFYLGDTKTAVAKLIVCICTCLTGGLVWGLLDAIIVIVNSLTRKSSINSLGMVAQFSEDEIEPAHTLAVIGVVVQIFFCCGGPRFLSFAHARLFGRKEPPQATAGPANGPGGALLSAR